ncbi:hypothetical protein [Photobacterium kasasachensis]|uniref:hypothetical protein n=1 Tax=Photobacterium kasasachensis TaxID=2910240 RepID=UPI003D120AC6
MGRTLWLALGHYQMNDFEKLLISVFIDAYPDEGDALRSQLIGCSIEEREFTNGGGVFITFNVNENSIPVSQSFLGEFSYICGPSISSSELECGSCTDFNFTEKGFVDHVEIQALANDYPSKRHPLKYEIQMP